MCQFISIIIVSHNSEKFLKKNISCLARQTILPKQIIIVDSGSTNITYITTIIQQYNLNINFIARENVGFATANNIGIEAVSTKATHIIFLNPDCFLPGNFIEQLINISHHAEAFTGKLLTYDVNTDRPTEVMDSTGIFQTWYGRWFDRGQGEVDIGQYDGENEQTIPAICGALMIIKKDLIDEILKKEEHIFNEDFFMYKEDIELSLRIKQTGRELYYYPALVAFHCRGWEQKRRKIPRWARLCSSRNDLAIAFKYNFKSIPFALGKYILVLFFNL